MSPVGWKDHTHVCRDCAAIFSCDGSCSCVPLCEPCASYQRAVNANDMAATRDYDISRHERFTRGTPIGEVERRAFDREFYGD